MAYVLTYLDDLDEDYCEAFTSKDDFEARLQKLLGHINTNDHIHDLNAWEFDSKKHKWYKANINTTQGPWDLDDYADVTGKVTCRGRIIAQFGFRVDGRA